MEVVILIVAFYHVTIFRGNEGEARREGSEEQRIAEFLTALALCHTVQVAIQCNPIQSNPIQSNALCHTDQMAIQLTATCLVLFHCISLNFR